MTARELIEKVLARSTRIDADASGSPTELASEARQLARMLKKAIEGLERANKHCEAIALSSLLPPMETGAYSEGGFFQTQATRSVGSGGRAHHILKETLAELDRIASTDVEIASDENCNPCHERCKHRPEGM